MDEVLRRDQNSAVVLGGITDDSNQYIRMLRVDPVTGRLLVSGTGGGGGTGYQDPLTGSLGQQTFTWTTAPKAICVDGNTINKVSLDGTVNWTGTTTTVLTIAPNNNIFAVA